MRKFNKLGTFSEEGNTARQGGVLECSGGSREVFSWCCRHHSQCQGNAQHQVSAIKGLGLCLMWVMWYEIGHLDQEVPNMEWRCKYGTQN